METKGDKEIHATFVCLANSKKHGGRCLAGKASWRGSFNKWIRPVTDRPTEELQEPEFRLHTGEDARLLDVLEIRLIRDYPNLHQQENFLMNVSVPLKKVRTFTIDEATAIVDKPSDLWGIGHSSSKGINDFVAKNEIEAINNSLYFIRVPNLKIEITDEYSQSWHRHQKVFRAGFSIGQNPYKLKITDPHFEEKYREKPLGCYEIEDSLLTISLGEEFNNSYWKLVAGLIPVSYGKNWSVT